MVITGQVAAVVEQFQKDDPKAGTPTLSKGGGGRSVDEQMEIILQPKRKNNDLNIKGRFLEEFKLEALPVCADLTPGQTAAEAEGQRPEHQGAVPGGVQVEGVAGLCGPDARVEDVGDGGD